MTTLLTNQAMPDQPALPPVRAAVAAVVVRDGKLLVGERRGPRGAGMLAVPGGSMKPGESLAAALRREMLEETGLVAEPLPFSTVRPELFLVNHALPAAHHLVVFHQCQVVGGTLTNTEPERCAGWEWMTLQKIAARLPETVLTAWREGHDHPDLCWMPLAQLCAFREHLGLS